MDAKEKTNKEKRFQEGDFIFPFRKFEEMAEMMRSCCKGEGGMFDCCSMMTRMMQHREGEGSTKKKKDTGETV
jgi:hypothetical protein